MLRGWVVEERDFESGENTAVDRNGHGTAVAGLVVYGDIARCIDRGIGIRAFSSVARKC